MPDTTVKLANSVSPSKFRQVKFPQKTGLENDKRVFHKEKLNAIDTIYEKHILSLYNIKTENGTRL